jgi:mono/diheme cytochrome c family protein
MKLQSFSILGVVVAGLFSAQTAAALPFNDDMVDVQKRTGVMMRQKAPGSVAVGLTDYDLQLANPNNPVERDKLAATLVNPHPGDSASVANGKRLFAINCQPCHGDISKQPVKPGVVGEIAVASNSQMPPNLTSDVYKDRTAGSIYTTIHFGIRLMPGHGWKLSPSEKWDIVNYVQSYQAK